jgi:hypothetical protein
MNEDGGELYAVDEFTTYKLKVMAGTLKPL